MISIVKSSSLAFIVLNRNKIKRRKNLIANIFGALMRYAVDDFTLRRNIDLGGFDKCLRPSFDTQSLTRSKHRISIEVEVP